MTGRLALQKCWNHTYREAVARCPECARSYCRECIVEHEDRIMCASCLARLTSAGGNAKRAWSLAGVVRLGGVLVGVLVSWFVFFSVGRMLLSVPDRFHANTLWERAVAESLREDEP